MWITMKTHYIQDEEDIGEILLKNMNEFNNVFELNKKNILLSNKLTIPGMVLTLLKANLTSLKIQKTNSSKSLLRKNSKKYYVSCLNIKNEKGECFSSLIDNLLENDRIIIINGVVLKQFTMCNNNKLTVLVRPQDNSLVILFKFRNLLENSISILENNLSLLTGSGVYSIFGNVKKIIRYYDEELISIRLQSHDKSSLKTLKYFHFITGYENIINNKTASSLKYDFLSNKVDILVKTPSNDFTSLSLKQRICLNNVAVEHINCSDIFLLHMNGYSHNIKADPIETGIVNSLRPPKRHFLIPNELKPSIGLKFKKLSDEVQVVTTDNIQELNTNISPLKKEPLNVPQSKHSKIKFIDLSNNDDDDDIVNLSPCQDFLTSSQIIKKKKYVYNSASSLGKNKVNIIDDNSLPIKYLRSDDKVKKYKDDSSVTPSNKDTSLQKSKICFQRDTSPSSSADGSCSPSFFNSQPESLVFNQDTQSNIVSQPTQTIKKKDYVHNSTSSLDKNKVNIIDDNSLPIKHLRSDDKVKKYKDNSSLTQSNKDTSLQKSKICFQRDTSPSSSADGSCSPSFFNSQPESLVFNQDTQSNIVSQPTQTIKKKDYVHNSASSLGKNKVNIINDNSLPIKHLRSDDKVKKYKDNSSLTQSNKDTSLQKSKICSQRDTSPISSSDGTYSPSFFNSQPESFIINQDTRSNIFESNIASQPTQCIGPCRLIYTVPNIFDGGEIVSGYCTKCKSFVQKCYLKLASQSSNMGYKCPKCSTIVHLNFFFIMNFLYGKNESQAIEVCCYDKKAESVVRKISKKQIRLEDYLSNQNDKQRVISSMKSLINNRTKVNIIVCLSPDDNKNILLGIDTKYVVTNTTQ